MTDKPKISILMGSKNGGRFVRETLDSILKQSFTDYELVVVDCLSTDNSLDILQEYKDSGMNVRWKSEQDRHTDEGVYKAMEMARGEYIMFMCISDGYNDPDWFKKCVDVLDSDPEVSMVYGSGFPITEDGVPLDSYRQNYSENPPPSKEEFFPFWLGTFTLCLELAWCVRADVFRKCFPKFEESGYFLQNQAVFAFNYNFNIGGYLTRFLTGKAIFGREHGDSNSVTMRKFNAKMKEQYKTAITKYANDLFSGLVKHSFRDGNSNVIKELSREDLDSFRKKALHYRINRRAYLCRRDRGFIRYWRKKLKILALYYLSNKRIYR